MADMSRTDLGYKPREKMAPPDTMHYAGVQKAIGEALNHPLVALYKAWMQAYAPTKSKKLSAEDAEAKIEANRLAFMKVMLPIGYRIVPKSLIDINWR